MAYQVEMIERRRWDIPDSESEEDSEDINSIGSLGSLWAIDYGQDYKVFLRANFCKRS
jgi:hypothetical protein